MKKSNLLLAAGIVLSATQTNGQTIQAAVQGDVAITTTVSSPPANTGIDIAPHKNSGGVALDFTAVAYDDPTASFYEIKWFNPSGSLIATNGGSGGDPDVSYYSNPDLTAVAYCDWSTPSTVWLDVYTLVSFPGPPPTYGYNTANITNVGNGTYPNIDINSFGDGVYCFEDGGRITLRSFTPSGGPTSIFGSAVVVGTGVQPDVILTDDNQFAVVTYVNGADLNIDILDYNDLQNGVASIIASYHYPSWGTGIEFPRIASCKNAGFLSPHDFTVVAEDHGSPGTLIRAFSFTGLSPASQYVVNQGLTDCTNNKPVVTYTTEKIVFSWSADYSSCTHTVAPPNSTHTDVLLREYDGNSFTPLHGGDHFEVNRLQGAFYQSNVAINTQKDGNYVSTGREATVYSNNSTNYYKNRTSTTFYEPAKEKDRNTGVARRATGGQAALNGLSNSRDIGNINYLELIGNPVESTMTIESSDVASTHINLLSATGRVINLNGRITSKGNQLMISMSDLAPGVYFLHGEVNGFEKVIRVSRM